MASSQLSPDLRNPLFSICILVLMLDACGPRHDSSSPTSGQLHIVCDESVFPAFEDGRRAFERNYPASNIRMTMATAGDAMVRLLNNEIDFVISARGFDSSESEFLLKNDISVQTQKVALDGLAVLVNRVNPIAELSADQLADVLSGHVKDWRQLADSLDFPTAVRAIDIVHDGPKSSNYHALRSQVLDKQAMTSGEIVAGDSMNSSSVLIMEYVASRPSAIGYVSTAWLGNHPEYVTRADRLKVLRLAHVDFHKAVDPIPGYIYRGDYPLRRALYVFNRQKSIGLGAGFIAYLTGNDGQRLLLEQNLVPAVNPVKLRYE